MSTCNGCGCELTADNCTPYDFERGHRCRACRRVYNKTYRETHRQAYNERLRAFNTTYRARDRDKYNDTLRQWRKDNPERMAEIKAKSVANALAKAQADNEPHHCKECGVLLVKGENWSDYRWGVRSFWCNPCYRTLAILRRKAKKQREREARKEIIGGEEEGVSEQQGVDEGD